MRMSASVWGMLGALSLLWGGSYLFIALAVAELPVLTVVAGRVALAALALWLLVGATGRPVPRGPQVWGALAVMALLNNVVPFTLITWAQAHMAAGLASILVATTPIFTALVAGALLADERLTPSRLAGVVAGFAGAAIVIGPELLAGLGRDVAAQGACLLAALFYAVSSVWGRRFGGMGLDPVANAAGVLTMSSLMLVPPALVLERPWTLPAPGAEAVAALVALALLATSLAYVLFYRILAEAGTNVMLVTFLIPVSAILLGAVVLGERLHLLDLAGMALIGLGMLAIDGRVRVRRAART